MWSILVRVVIVMVGLLIVSDVARPLSTETLTIGRKTLRFDMDWPVLRDISAKLYFSDGTLESCQVGFRAFSRLEVGDVVTITSTHTLRSCVGITRDGDVIASGRFWRWTTGAFGALFVLLGLFGKEDRNRRREVDV